MFIQNFLHYNNLDKPHLKAVLRVRKLTIKTCKRMPKNLRYVITNSLLELAKDATVYCMKAENIILSAELNIDEFKFRQGCLQQASSSLMALQEEVAFLYSLIELGNTCFRNKEEYDLVFDKWFAAVKQTHKLVNNVYINDKVTIKKMKGI